MDCPLGPNDATHRFFAVILLRQLICSLLPREGCQLSLRGSRTPEMRIKRHLQSGGPW